MPSQLRVNKRAHSQVDSDDELQNNTVATFTPAAYKATPIYAIIQPAGYSRYNNTYARSFIYTIPDLFYIFLRVSQKP
jgi:hypothetical protein